MSPALARRIDPWLTRALAIGLPLLAAALLHGDSNWDLRNYHLYNVHAWWTGRGAIDVAAAQLQSWHNPLLDLPLYLLAQAGASARLLTLWLVLPAMLSLWALFRLQDRVSPAPPSAASRVVLALLSLTGAAAGSTLGLSMDDGFVAAGMLAALCIALSGDEASADGAQAGPRATVLRWLLAGLVAGATAGLKLSAGFYCIALAIAALPGGSLRTKAGRLAALALGGILGMALAYGPWAWHLQQAFGNPFFPYFNDVFASPAALPWDWVDARFKPHSAGDVLLAPWRLLVGTRAYSELSLRDPRLLIGLLAFAWLAWTTRGTRDDARATRLRALAAFLWSGVGLWLLQSGIYRYAAGLEMLSVLGLACLVARLRGGVIAWVVLLLAVAAVTRQPHWGRDAGPQSLASMRAPALGDGALVVTATGDPLAYLALGLPGDVPMLGLANNFMQPDRCSALQQRVSARIARQVGPIWLLEDPSAARGSVARALLREHYDLYAVDACLPYANPLAPAQLCPLQRRGAAIAPCLGPGLSVGTRSAATPGS